jgi:hypothetical protein
MADAAPVQTVTLDEAWAEAEAALPQGWHLHNVNREWTDDGHGLAGWRASANDGKFMVQAVVADTPTAALLALAAKFRRVQ